jgi:hypothetical protein
MLHSKTAEALPFWVNVYPAGMVTPFRRMLLAIPPSVNDPKVGLFLVMIEHDQQGKPILSRNQIY